MKSYQERLPMIDRAIEHLKGTLKTDFLFEVKSGIYYFTSSFNKGRHLNLICTREEFEQRKAELQNKPKWEDHPDAKCFVQNDEGGWYKNIESSDDVKANGNGYWHRYGGVFIYIQHGKVIGNWQDTLEKRPETKEQPMKYEYGVEYEPNGEKPDLPDDVKLYINFMGDGMYMHSGEINLWSSVKSFRIVDERYKQKEQDMNDRYKNGELPPAGSVVEYHVTGGVYVKCKVLAVDEDKLWLKTIEALDGYLKFDNVGSRLVCAAELVRPLRTETDKLVEQMERSFESTGCVFTNDHRALAEHLIEQGYRKVKPMSEQEFMNQCVDICNYGDARLYRAGCRLIEQGE